MKRPVLLLCIILMAYTYAEAITAKQVERVQQLKEEIALALKDGKFEHAASILNEIISIDPDEKSVSRYQTIIRQMEMEPACKEADEAFQDENYARAFEIWDNLLKTHPEDRRLADMIETTKNLISDSMINDLYNRAEKLISEGKSDAAVVEIEKILAMRPYEQRAAGMLSKIKNKLVDTRTKEYYLRAEQYMKEKKYDLAIDEWKKILKIDPMQEEASRSIAAAVRERMASLYAEAGNAYETGDYVTARDRYSKILADNPTDLDVKSILSRLNEVTNIVLKIDNKGQAADMLRKAISNYIAVDGNRKASMVAAWYAVQLDPSPLASAVRDFLERSNTSLLSKMEGPVGNMNIIDQYLFSALNHIYEGRYDLAIQATTIVIELEPGNLLAWKRLGSAYYALGKKDMARKSWEKALKIAPEDTELKQFIKQTK